MVHGTSMPTRRTFLKQIHLAALAAGCRVGSSAAGERLDPLGRIHIPIGIADTLDPLKTFVEAEGNFSPGFGSYGIYFWVYDRIAGRLFAPTMEEVACQHGLEPAGCLIPWSRWRAGPVLVTTRVCEVRHWSPAGDGFVAGALVRLKNAGPDDRRLVLFAALRPIGPAGYDVKRLEVSGDGQALRADGHTAIVAGVKTSAAGILADDSVGALAFKGEMPVDRLAESSRGDCSGALCFEWTLQAGAERSLGFVCPVLPGRSVARHHWADLKQNAMVDVAELFPAAGGVPQPDAGLPHYRSLKAADLFAQAEKYWNSIFRNFSLELPDPRWMECMRAILGHALLSMNEGAPDVSVINYNVFNRDGVYVANILQKSGLFHLAGSAIQYFLAHPFNGRAYPEADNPGQILWILSEHWLYTRDRDWLNRVYPSVQKTVALVGYYRTTPAPHWVDMGRFDFGDVVPLQKRRELKPGRCDGHNPAYTEAFDIAGVRGAIRMAEAIGNRKDARAWEELAGSFMKSWDERFGAEMRKFEYANYCVLWPCRLYPLHQGRAFEQFRDAGKQEPGSWRYFPLATAHQGLLAGNRDAGWATLEAHLAHPQMKGWYAFDEYDKGPGSGSGGWHKVRTTWPHSKEKPGENLSVAMPHGWAIAEVWLLMRDSLLHEDGGRLVLLPGVNPEWFRHASGMKLSGFQTHFGPCDLSWQVRGGEAVLRLTGKADPLDGYLLRLPASLSESVTAGGVPLPRNERGDWILPRGAREVRVSI